MSSDSDKIKKIKKLIEELKAKKKKAKKIPKAKPKSDKDHKAQAPAKRQKGAARVKKPKAVFAGPHGGEYTVLGNGKKKYGISKSLIQDYVKQEIKTFVKGLKEKNNG